MRITADSAPLPSSRAAAAVMRRARIVISFMMTKATRGPSPSALGASAAAHGARVSGPSCGMSLRPSPFRP